MKKKMLFSILIIVMTVTLFSECIGYSQYNTDETTNKKEANNNNNKEIYEIKEFLNEEQFKEYMNDNGSLFSRLCVFKKK